MKRRITFRDKQTSPDGSQLISEDESAGSYGKYAIGSWFYTTKFDDIVETDSLGVPLQRSGNYGIYAIAEQKVYKEKQNPDQGFSLFTRFGMANEDINQLQYYS